MNEIEMVYIHLRQVVLRMQYIHLLRKPYMQFIVIS